MPILPGSYAADGNDHQPTGARPSLERRFIPGSFPAEEEENVVSVQQGFRFGDQIVSAEDVRRAAAEHQTTPEAILRLGSPAGQAEQRFGRTIAGQALMRGEQAISGLAEAGLSLASRAGLLSEDVGESVRRGRKQREDFLNLIERGGDVEATLGQRGSRIFNSVSQSVAQFGTAGVGGSAAVFSSIAGDNFDRSLETADEAGLEGVDRVGFAAEQAVIETGITFLMGRAGSKLGLNSLEEALSPSMRNAAAKLVERSGVAKKIAGVLGGAGAEAGEEALVSLVQQLHEREDTGREFSLGEVVDSAIAGAVGAGAANVSTTVNKAINSQKLRETTDGAREAEHLLARDPQIREEFGQDLIPDAEPSTWLQTLNEAKRNNTAAVAKDTATAVMSEPRSLSPVETAGFTIRMSEIKNQYNDALQVVKDTPEGELIDATTQAEMMRLEGEMELLTSALRISGTEAGRALAARKLRLDQDMDLVTTMARATEQANRGRKQGEGKVELTPKARQKLQDAVAHYNDLAAKLKDPTTPADDAAQIRRDIQELQDQPRRQRTAEHNKLLFELAKARSEVNFLVREQKPKGIIGWGEEVLVNMGRTIMASMDLQPLGRQGAFFMASRPAMTLKAARDTMKTLFSEQAEFEVLEDIKQRPNWERYQQAGVFFHDPDSDATLREEDFMSRVAEKLPVVGPPIAASARLYTSFLNQLRADAFDVLSETLPAGGEPTLGELRALGNFVNVVTGRGGMGSWDGAMRYASTVFFAPRYTVSRFQTAMGVVAPGKTFGAEGRVKKAIQQEYARTVTGYLMFYMLADLAFGDDEDFSIGLDPMQSDFLKLRWGDTLLDPAAGMSQTARFIATMGNGLLETLSGTKNRTKRDEFNDAMRFIRTKLSPAGGFAANVFSGKTLQGEEIGVLGALGELMTPMTPKDIVDTWERTDFPGWVGLSAASLFGNGLQNYDK